MLTHNPSDPQRRPAFSNPDNAEERPDPSRNTPSRIFARDDDGNDRDDQNPRRRGEQVPVDLIDEESMESFPCSDPPSYSRCHI
jgi:hypothetical protein